MQHLSDLAQFTGRCGGAGWSRGPGCSFSIDLCSRLWGLLLVWGGFWFLLSYGVCWVAGGCEVEDCRFTGV